MEKTGSGKSSSVLRRTIANRRRIKREKEMNLKGVCSLDYDRVKQKKDVYCYMQEQQGNGWSEETVHVYKRTYVPRKRTYSTRRTVQYVTRKKENVQYDVERYGTLHCPSFPWFFKNDNFTKIIFQKPRTLGCEKKKCCSKKIEASQLAN